VCRKPAWSEYDAHGTLVFALSKAGARFILTLTKPFGFVFVYG